MAYEGPGAGTSIHWKILNDYNFAPFEETVYEQWELDNDNLVIRYARADHVISCYFEVDPDQVP